jgi:hypothetical protein
VLEIISDLCQTFYFLEIPHFHMSYTKKMPAM